MTEIFITHDTAIHNIGKKKWNSSANAQILHDIILDEKIIDILIDEHVPIKLTKDRSAILIFVLIMEKLMTEIAKEIFSKEVNKITR